MNESERARTARTLELLHTKYTPPRAYGPTVPRPSLLARLDAGLAHKLTLVAAPAGFGKTTLVSAWLATVTQPGAWLALDAGDNDPVRFWRYVLTACRVFDGNLAERALSLLAAPQPPFEAMLTSFINDLAQRSDAHILVLEDYDAITAPAVHETLTFLLEHLPSTLHLVLLTRAEPPLPLARLRARDELNELTAADLRFSAEEIEAFLQQTLRVSLTPETLARLATRTEGWAAGLRLMTLALHDRREPQEVERFLMAFSGGHRHVVEYLVGEVLAAQSESTQTFLLQTGFLNRLTAPLCDAVTGRNDGAFMLAQLERQNLFLIPLGESHSGSWHRYHTLFAEAMRHHARQRLGEETVRALHEKAGRWYESQAMLGEAIEMALAAKEFARAATLVEQFIERQGPNEVFSIRRWAERLPTEVLYAHPLLCFHYAQALLFTLDRYAPSTALLVETPLRVAEDAWRRDRNDARLGEVLAFRAVIGLWQGDLARSFAFARESLELLAEHDVFWRGVSLLNITLEERLSGNINTARRLVTEARALCEAAQNIHGALAATLMSGDICVQQGEFEQARSYYQEGLANAIGGDEMLDDQSMASLGLAAIAYEKNELDTAEQQAARALELAGQRANEDAHVLAAILLARTEQAHGHPAQAHQRLHALAARTQRPLLLRLVQSWQAALSLASGDVPAAQRWQADLGQPEGVPLTQQEREALISARLHMAAGDVKAALRLLAERQADAQREGRLGSELEIRCLQALAYAAQPDPAQAERTLVRALALGQSKGFRRVFLDEGEPMAALLRTIIPNLTERPLAAYATSLVRDLASAGTSRQPTSVSAPLLEPLSQQEARVLRLLAAGLSNPEIARELIVSVNTVKTQVQSIYRKLNVSSRSEARQAARELNLL